DGVAHLLEQFVFEPADPFLGAEHLRLGLLQLRGDVALGAGECLAPDVLGRHARRLAVAHLDPVAEDSVEPDSERRGAGAGAFAALELRDPVARLAGAAEELAERLAPPRADEPALGEHERRLADERLPQPRPELLEG